MSWSVVYMTVVFPLLLVTLLAIDLVGPARKSVQSSNLRTNRRPRSRTSGDTRETAL